MAYIALFYHARATATPHFRADAPAQTETTRPDGAEFCAVIVAKTSG